MQISKQNTILISSLSLQMYIESCLNNAHPDSTNPIIISLYQGRFSISNLSKKSIYFESKIENDFDFEISLRKLINLNKILKLVEEQPIVLNIDGDNNCIHVCEMII